MYTYTIEKYCFKYYGILTFDLRIKMTTRYLTDDNNETSHHRLIQISRMDFYSYLRKTSNI